MRIFYASTSTARYNFTEDNQQNSRLLDQFHSDSEELELSFSDDTSYSLATITASCFTATTVPMTRSTLDVQPSHHDINVDEERSSSTLAKDSSHDPLYAFPTTSGTFHSILTKSETCEYLFNTFVLYFLL